MSIALHEPEIRTATKGTPAVEVEPPAELAPPAERLFRLSVAQYLEMIRTNILGPDDRCELLEGILVAKMGKNPPHVIAGKLLFAALPRILPPGWHVAKEDPIVTAESVPEPDCAVVRGDIRDYGDRHPGHADMALVVEVSESSLAYDRRTKMRIYARAGIPVYWIVNLVDSRIEVYTDPTGTADRPTYRLCWAFGSTSDLPVILDGREVGRIAVSDLLP